MAETTIEWTKGPNGEKGFTFNPWIGCTKVSPACDHCYAEADFDHRRHVVQWGAGQPRKHTAPSTWAMPVKWNAEAERLGVRYRVFCASLADVFDNEVPVEWRNELFEVIKVTPHLDWLLLTKRVGNVKAMLPSATSHEDAHLFAELWPNVWIGASITSQAEADRDIPKLLAVPAAKRFLSMEPLLGPVKLDGHEYRLAPGLWEGVDWLTGMTSQHSDIFGGDTSPWCNRDSYEFPKDACEPRIHWVIVGGESGPNARPMHPDWARSLRNQCQAAGVPFFFKQWGEWAPDEGFVSMRDPMHEWLDGDFIPSRSWRRGKKAAGRLLDGRTWDEVPA